MGVSVYGIRYGDFNTLNAYVENLIQIHARELDRIQAELENWKSRPQKMNSSELSLALGMLYFPTMPDEQALNQRRRELSLLFHPDRNPKNSWTGKITDPFSIPVK